MKKMVAIMLGVMMLSSCYLGGCKDPQDDTPDDPDQPSGVTDEVLTDRPSIEYAYGGVYTKNELSDGANGFSSADDITGGRYFVNGSYQKEFTNYTTRQDIKLELYNETGARMVNVSAGMAFTLPATEIDVDYTIAKYRTQYAYDDVILTVSSESSNPYTSLADPWYTYGSEWLMCHLINEDYYANNNLTLLKELDFDFTVTSSHGNLTVKPGYDVYTFAIRIEDEDNVIERPYYNIAVIREANDVKTFALFVMKSKSDRSEEMDAIVQSFARLSAKGLQRNYFDAGEPTINENWNESTKKYYELLTSSKTVNWGVFSWSMPGLEEQLEETNSYYQYILEQSRLMQTSIEDAWGYEFDIYPTYTHIGSGTNYQNYSAHHFPSKMAEQLAGGDGFNGKPVLQFTYQFTLNNNIVSAETTPMFEVLRGKYDEQFRRLARDIKNYEKPVLFRLNNEMNTDWTSYSGMMTLLDPDIFIMTWQRLYNIFEEEGVDNAIWIWNPIATSCPYSSWGEDLCFFPGKDYVQLLGGTSYEMNNYDAAAAATSVVSFESHYSSLYEKNEEAFSQWKLIISEFACGSGGDYSGVLGRNGAVQAKWVADMFTLFNAEEKPAWVSQIVGAVWFNCNDSIGGKVSNRLRFIDPNGGYEDLAATVEAFRQGFANRK